MTTISNKTSFLYAVPSFLRGMARVLDVGSTFSAYNQAENGDNADYNALRSDWMQTGDDMRTAMGIYENGQ